MGLFGNFMKRSNTNSENSYSEKKDAVKQQAPEAEPLKYEPVPTSEVAEKASVVVEGELVPGVGRIPFPAYRGDEPYIFVSYAHKDAGDVFPIIRKFHDQGYYVWYDEGIAAGNEWTDEIANALENCSLFLIFLTENSAGSSNCRDEVGYAIDYKIPFLAIHLKETVLSGGLRLRIGTKQAILKYTMSEEEFEYKYTFAFENLGLPVPEFIKENRKQNVFSNAKIENINKGDRGGKDYIFKTKKAVATGTATISLVDGKEYHDIPADSIYSMFGTELQRGAGFGYGLKEGIIFPKLRDIKSLESVTFPGDSNSYHKKITVNKINGESEAFDIQTAYSDITFLNGRERIRLDWGKIGRIDIDWKHGGIENWPELARIHRRSGEIIIVPSYTLNMAILHKPEENQISFDTNYRWRDSIDTERGTTITLEEISSISFGPIIFEADSWRDNWYKEIPVGILFKDGRMLQTYLKHDWVAFCGMDDFGCVETTADNISHIDFVSTSYEEVQVPDPAQSGKSESVARSQMEANNDLKENMNPEEAEKPDPDVKFSKEMHQVGDYLPKGTVKIQMKDGTEIIGIANSLCLMAKGMEKRGGQNEYLYNSIFEPENEMDEGRNKEVTFAEMESIKVQDSLVIIEDMDEEKTEIHLPERSYFWFIGEEKKYEPTKIKVSDVTQVTFIRGKLPDIDVKYLTVYTKEGKFKAPAAFLCVKYNEGNIVPSMRYAHDFRNFSGFPVKAKNTLMIEVTKSGASGSMFAPPKGMEMRAFMKDEEIIDFSMDGFFSIDVMARHGSIASLKRESTQCIDFR